MAEFISGTGGSGGRRKQEISLAFENSHKRASLDLCFCLSKTKNI